MLRTILYKIWMLIDGPAPEEPQKKPRQPSLKRNKGALPGTWAARTKVWGQHARLPALIVATLLVSQSLWLLLPSVGIYANQLALGLLLVLGLHHQQVRHLALSAAILPTLNVCIALFDQPTRSLQLAVAYVILLALTLVYRSVFTLDKSLTSDKLNKTEYFYAVPLMIVLGQIIGVVAAFMAGHSENQIIHLPLVLALAVATLAAITEELFFRGLIQQYALKLLHPVTAVALTTLIFTPFVVGSGSWWIIVPALLASVVLSTVYCHKQNLTLTTTLNLTVKLVFVGIIFIHFQ